jgi:hypothetical protein
VKRVIYLVAVALVAMLILVPTAAVAQQMEATVEREVEATVPLPPSGGLTIGGTSVLLPAAALLVGGGVLAYAVLRRR